MSETKFYKLLKSAKDNEADLVKVLDKIMPLVNSSAKNKRGKIDEDLKSYLIEYAISVVKTDGFAEKLLRNKKI